MPSLCGNAAPILVQRLPALPLLSYSSTVKEWIVARFPGRCEFIALRRPCFAQALGNHRGCPFDACVSPLERCGKNFPVLHAPASE